jgi:hypothetical protein
MRAGTASAQRRVEMATPEVVSQNDTQFEIKKIAIYQASKPYIYRLFEKMDKQVLLNRFSMELNRWPHKNENCNHEECNQRDNQHVLKHSCAV